MKHSKVDFLFKYVQCRLFYNVSSGLLWSVVKLLTHANFTSPSLSDFIQSGVLECLWLLKKAEKTLEPLERKVKTLLTEAHCRECPEIKQKVGDSLFNEKVAQEILKNQKVLVATVCMCPLAPERICIQMSVGKLL